MSADVPPPDGIVSSVSPHSLDETLARLKGVVTEKGLTLVCEVDHAAAAQSVGLQMQRAHVLIFGNPRAGTPLMQAAPLVALELPLKVLVWQDGDGTVRVTYQSPAYLAERYALPPELVPNVAGLDGLVGAVVAP